MGIDVDCDEIKERVTEWFSKTLKINVEVEEAKRIREKMISVKLPSKEEKFRVQKNAFNLKATKIFINDDLTYKERTIQKKLKGIADEYRNKNEEARIRIRYG